MRRRVRVLSTSLVVAVGVAFTAVACSSEPATQVIVVLHAESALLAEAASVHVAVRNDEGQVVLDRAKSVTRGEGAVAHVPLVPVGDNPARRFTLTATLSNAADAELARVEARSGYVANELRELHVWFDDACRSVACGDGRTCQGGSCVGSCFAGDVAGTTTRTPSQCRECETCGVTCEAASGLPCGCPGEACSAGVCVPKERVRHVASGKEHTCASLDSRDVFCWGRNDFEGGGVGQLGTGADGPDIVTRPARVPGADGWRGLGAGVHHTCALDEDMQLYCWGENYKGQLAQPDVAVRTTAARSRAPGLSSLACGAEHACGMRGDTTDLYCWGSNVKGNLGVAVGVLSVAEPTLVGDGFAMVSAGGEHTCALRTNGDVACWGFNDSGELGARVGTSSSAPVTPGCEPTNAPGTCFHDYQRIGVGWYHSCGIRAGGALYCWGGNFNGQLGSTPSASDFNRPEPTQVGAGTIWSDVAGGRSHTCAIDQRGNLHCWGLNADGQLGFGSDGIVHAPTRVDPSSRDTWVALSLGEYHTCAIRSDRTLWCWGNNDFGQIGIGSASSSPVAGPRRVCF